MKLYMLTNNSSGPRRFLGSAIIISLMILFPGEIAFAVEYKYVKLIDPRANLPKPDIVTGNYNYWRMSNLATPDRGFRVSFDFEAGSTDPSDDGDPLLDIAVGHGGYQISLLTLKLKRDDDGINSHLSISRLISEGDNPQAKGIYAESSTWDQEIFKKSSDKLPRYYRVELYMDASYTKIVIHEYRVFGDEVSIAYVDYQFYGLKNTEMGRLLWTSSADYIPYVGTPKEPFQPLEYVEVVSLPGDGTLPPTPSRPKGELYGVYNIASSSSSGISSGYSMAAGGNDPDKDTTITLTSHSDKATDWVISPLFGRGYTIQTYYSFQYLTNRASDIDEQNARIATYNLRETEEDRNRAHWTFIRGNKGGYIISNWGENTRLGVEEIKEGAEVLSNVSDAESIEWIFGLARLDPARAFVPLDRVDANKGKQYAIAIKGDGKVLSVNRASHVRGRSILGYTFHGGTSQLWKFLQLDNGSYSIYNVNSGQVLHAREHSYNNTSKGTIVQWSADGRASQQFSKYTSDTLISDYLYLNNGKYHDYTMREYTSKSTKPYPNSLKMQYDDPSLDYESFYLVEVPEQDFDVTWHDAREGVYVRGGAHADSNFNQDSVLAVMNSGMASDEREIFLKFDLSGYSSEDFISAHLALWPDVATADALGEEYGIHPVYNDSWDEAGLTWNNKPVFAPSLNYEAISDSSIQDFDISDIALEAINSDGILSMVLTAKPSGSDNLLELISDEDTLSSPGIYVKHYLER